MSQQKAQVPSRAKNNYPAKRPRRYKLLILECDTTKLQTHGLSVAEIMQSTLGILSDKIVTISTTSESQLLRDFQNLVETKKLFDTILVIAHSNRKEIVLTSDRRLRWQAFSKWLEPVQPRHILLLACEAGQVLPAKAMSDNISSLKDIHASPVHADKR